MGTISGSSLSHPTKENVADNKKRITIFDFITTVLMGQIYKKVLTLSFLLVTLLTGCHKDIAPLTTPPSHGRYSRQVKRENRRRAWQAYWHDRKTNRLTSDANKKIKKSNKAQAHAEKKLREKHVKNQTEEVQEQMKNSLKEAQKNNPKRSLRQRLRLWKFKKK